MPFDPAHPKRSAPKTILTIAVSAVAGLVIGVAFVGGRIFPGAETGASQAGAQPGQSGPGMRVQRPPPVTLVQIGTAPIDQTVNAIGTGRALQSLTLTADVSGIVEKIAIRPGETAAEGAILVQLEKREQEIAVARARADFNIARTNAARFAGLVDDEAASALEYESAQNELSATTAALKQAEYNLDRRAIRAPFAGIVGLTSLDIGDYVTAGATVTTIDDISSLIVDFRIPESASAFVSEGLEVKAIAQASGGRSVTGHIRAVDSRVDPATRTRHVEAALPNDDSALIPGSTFAISLNLRGRTAIKAPGLAVQWDRAGAYVWKVGANDTAERVQVVILKREAEYVLLDAALTPADRIVAEGAEMVRPGVPLVDRRESNADPGARTNPSAVYK